MNTTTKLIASNGEYNIIKFENREMPFLSYLCYDSKKFFYIKDLTSIMFQYNQRVGVKCDVINDINEFPDKALIEELLIQHSNMEEMYNKGVEKDSAIVAFMCHDKRSLLGQAYKIPLSGDFSTKALYNYYMYAYCRMEDCYAEIIELLKKLMCRDPKGVNQCIKDVLKVSGITDDTLIVYRGFNSKSRLNGTSFTFNKEIAQRFANRWGSNGYVNKYKVHIEDVLAYIEYEEEIVTEKAVLLEENV